MLIFFFQAEDGIRDLRMSRGLGDVYKRQTVTNVQIADALMDKGIDIDRRSITIDADVKSLGEYTATIHLLGEIKPQLKFWVVKAD